jgi:hypothetical protein
VPIIMVSAAVETESRLQGLSRGADDYVTKPFSPKELIARIKRLLERSSESREAHRRGRAFEHDLTQAREDAKRSHTELRGEQRLRELTHEFVRDFHGLLDADRLGRRLLLEAEAHLGSAMIALLCPDAGGGRFHAGAWRGEVPPAVERLALRGDGELATLLAGLGRPARLRELERFPELRAELAPFVAAGIAVFAPLRDPAGLVAVLVADERGNGDDLRRGDLDVVAVLCDTVALALRNARRGADQAESTMDALEALMVPEAPPARLATRAEAAMFVSEAATTLPPSLRGLVSRAVRLGDWAREEPGARVLAAMAARDPSGRIARLARLLAAARADAANGPAADETEELAAAALARVGLAYADARDLGLAPEVAAETALAAAGACLDELLRSVLLGATASRSR